MPGIRIRVQHSGGFLGCLVAILVVLGGLPTPASATSTTLLRLDGIGPLQLGMTSGAAVATGWLAGQRTGCPLGGPPLPITYTLTGRAAPRGIRGTAEFRGGRLRNLTFRRGVRTTTGVIVGRTTPRDMVARYRSAGFSAVARFDATFRGTFVTVRRRGRQVIGGFAEAGHLTLLGVPAIPVCE